MSISLNLKIDEKCKITQEKIDALSKLLSEIIPLCLDDFDFFNTLITVPDDDIEEKVNMVIKNVYGDKKYKTGSTIPKGVAVPIENESTFYCLIFLGESLLKDISIKHYHQSEVVSTLIEELLHVKLYTIIKKQHGYIQKVEKICTSEADIFTICSLMLDEFIVNRWKATIIASNPLIENNGALTCGIIQYGEELQPILNNSFKRLLKIVRGAAVKTISINDAWGKLLYCIYREIFEPLSRNAAFSMKYITESSIDDDINGSWFYDEHIKPYWHRTYKEFLRAINNIEDIDSALAQLTIIIREFLEYIGVTFKKLENKKSWVYFDSTFLVNIQANTNVT